MDFTAIRDFYGIDNTLYRLGTPVSVSESKLMDPKTGKVKPEIKHLHPISKDAIAFTAKHLVVQEEKSAPALPEKVRGGGGRGRSAPEPFASNKTEKVDDDSDAGITIVGAPFPASGDVSPIASNDLFNQGQ